MKKVFIKMNNNDEHLSLGNLFRIIKDSSKNKTSALQSELFCTLFEIDSINDTTVSNYCVGCRGIGGEFKQVFLTKSKRYKTNKEEFCDNIIGILCIVDGILYNVSSNKIEFINNNESALYLAKKLYNIAKNDKEVDKETCNYYGSLIKNNKVYECLVEQLLFIVLEKRQPIYEDELKKEVFENILNDTSISSLSLQEYLSLKLREGINFDYAMKELALNGNAYANYEIGSNEYYGFVKNHPRYDVAYEYLKRASDMHHAGALYMLGNMFVRGFIGSKSNEELETGYGYLKESFDLGNIAASNLIGYMYLYGVHPLEKNEKEAIKYFTIAKDSNYAFAINNLGHIEETKGNYDKAFELYVKSADLGESWACNKVGEWYREGKIVKDMEKAFYYYNRALESNYRTLCYFAYYNLAKYFYLEGYGSIAFKDVNKALEYLKIASNNGVFKALLELFYLSVKDYLKDSSDSNYNQVMSWKKKIERHAGYNNMAKKEIEDTIEKIKKDKLDVNI